MSKPKLYVALDGPILIPGGHDHLLNAEVAPYAKPFMHWAVNHFDVHFLTDRSPREAFHAAHHLALPEDAVTPVGYGENKTDAFHPHDDFYWLDSILLPSEVAWLAEHGKVDRTVTVDPLEGVTPAHKDRLEKALRRR